MSEIFRLSSFVVRQNLRLGRKVPGQPVDIRAVSARAVVLEGKPHLARRARGGCPGIRAGAGVITPAANGCTCKVDVRAWRLFDQDESGLSGTA